MAQGLRTYLPQMCLISDSRDFQKVQLRTLQQDNTLTTAKLPLFYLFHVVRQEHFINGAHSGPQHYNHAIIKTAPGGER